MTGTSTDPAPVRRSSSLGWGAPRSDAWLFVQQQDSARRAAAAVHERYLALADELGVGHRGADTVLLMGQWWAGRGCLPPEQIDYDHAELVLRGIPALRGQHQSPANEFEYRMRLSRLSEEITERLARRPVPLCGCSSNPGSWQRATPSGAVRRPGP
jgi:hypothetical protein